MKPAKVYAAQAAYLDPANCDSIVGYTIGSRTRLSATVDLSDCTRKIQWYFTNDDAGLRKIDTALHLLSSFKRDFLMAQKKFKVTRKRRTRKAA